MSKTIIVVGPVIIDKHYFIDEYPNESALATIKNTSFSIGGAGNIIIDLVKLDSNINVVVKSALGKDKEASLILEEFKKYKRIDTSRVTILDKTPCTHVMNSKKTKERTFFFDPASNKDFSIEHVDLDYVKADLLQVEYIGLIGKLMDREKQYGSYIAKLLFQAQKRGIKTSIDMVSKSDDKTIEVAKSALKYTDYCTINEIEAESVSGVRIVDNNGNINEERIINALHKLKQLGVSTWVVIHSQFCSYGLDCKSDKVYKAESLHIPKRYIKGTTGAGDAFLAGILISINKKFSLDKALKVASCTAGCSLAAVDGTSAMKAFDEVMKLFDIYGKKCIYETLRE